MSVQGRGCGLNSGELCLHTDRSQLNLTVRFYPTAVVIDVHRRADINATTSQF